MSSGPIYDLVLDVSTTPLAPRTRIVTKVSESVSPFSPGNGESANSFAGILNNFINTLCCAGGRRQDKIELNECIMV